MNKITAVDSSITEDAEFVQAKEAALIVIRREVTGDPGEWEIRDALRFVFDHGFGDNVRAAMDAWWQYMNEYAQAIEYRDADGTTIQGFDRYCTEHGLDFVSLMFRGEHA